jgi:hypothetical protein
MNMQEEQCINDISDHVKIVLLSGKAEIFGAELPLQEGVFFN